MTQRKLKEGYVRKNKVGLLKDVEEEFYPIIFKWLSTTVVLGNNKKYNTLINLKHTIMTADDKALKKMGFPVDNSVKTELIKTILVKCIDMSIEIRREQWKTASDETKDGKFEARKHRTEEAIVDRNERMMRKLHIGPETAKRFGVALSVEELVEGYALDDEKREKMIQKSLKDPAFKTFYENYQAVYKLGEPTAESLNFLNAIYEDLKKGEANSFGLKGYSLKTALNLVEAKIRIRRSTFDFNEERKNRKVETPEETEVQEKQ